MTSKTLLCALLLAAASAATAGDAPRDPALEQARAALLKRFPTARADDLRPTPVPGLWEFSRGVDVFYITSDARYVFRGDILDFAGNLNLTDERRAELRRARLADVPESLFISFGPAAAKHVVTVFTDVDCSYCRRLHSEIAQINARGIRVRYLFYPRAGLGSESWQKAQDVWCAPDRQAAMTAAKRGQAVPRRQCDASAVLKGYQLGEAFKLEGTPLVLSPEGYELGGYLRPDDLLHALERHAARAPRG
jgi:thiol:disulfide interchange protein DsbC